MPKFHIDVNGEPAFCRAKQRPCPRGGEENHFTDIMEATREAERRHTNQYGVTASKEFTEETPTVTLNEEPSRTRFVDHVTIDGKTGQALMRYTGSAEDQQDLGVRSNWREGKLVSGGAFAPVEVSGVINRDNLNKHSYKEFGFTSVSSSEYADTRYKDIEDSHDHSTILESSKAETGQMSSVSTSALNFFSSNNYEWFNTYMRRPWELKQLPDDDENAAPFVSGEIGKDVSHVSPNGDYSFNHGDYMYDEPERLTVSNIEDTVDKMDAALDNGAKEQRIVYRGVSFSSPMFSGYKSILDYTANNLSLGTEISFDNYQSSSLSAGVGYRYSQKGDTPDGMVYEILTPEGANITSISNYRSEKEVLLPREQKYVVVGKHSIINNPEVSGSVQVIQLVAVNNKGEVLDGTNADPFKPFRYDPEVHVNPASQTS